MSARATPTIVRRLEEALEGNGVKRVTSTRPTTLVLRSQDNQRRTRQPRLTRGAGIRAANQHQLRIVSANDLVVTTRYRVQSRADEGS